MKIRLRRILVLVVICLAAATCCTLAQAAEKAWTGSGDGTSWTDDDNWVPSVAPTASDDAIIDFANASVACSQTYKAKSITIGGSNTSALTSNNFIFGTINPGSPSNVAVTTRPGGTFILKGAGTVTFQGQYQDSEKTLAPEPGFMFWIK